MCPIYVDVCLCVCVLTPTLLCVTSPGSVSGQAVGAGPGGLWCHGSAYEGVCGPTGLQANARSWKRIRGMFP